MGEAALMDSSGQVNQHLSTAKAPEHEIVRDMLKRGIWATPALVLVFGLIWGIPGALSTLYGIAIVCVNFALAATINSWAAKISPAVLGAAAMFGFLARLGLIFIAVLLVREASWVSLIPLALTIVITHLGLLFWEMRFVSASLAFPALRPGLGSDTKTSGPNRPARPSHEETQAP